MVVSLASLLNWSFDVWLWNSKCLSIHADFEIYNRNYHLLIQHNSHAFQLDRITHAPNYFIVLLFHVEFVIYIYYIYIYIYIHIYIYASSWFALFTLFCVFLPIFPNIALTHCSEPLDYLNQCWDINCILRNKLQWNFNRNSCIFVQQNPCQNVVWKWRPFCLGLNELTTLSFWFP